jgi:hypothetical protein
VRNISIFRNCVGPLCNGIVVKIVKKIRQLVSNLKDLWIFFKNNQKKPYYIKGGKLLSAGRAFMAKTQLTFLCFGRAEYKDTIWMYKRQESETGPLSFEVSMETVGKQAGAELCQAQVKLGLANLDL